MSDYLLSLKNEIGLYFNLIQYFFYFCIGALIIVILRKLIEIFNFFFSRFSKEKLVDRFTFILKLLVFILISTLLGWVIVNFVF
jgi:hypothetical protein